MQTRAENAALAAQRRSRIMTELRDSGAVRVTKIAREHGVSPSTIRRDLAALHRQGALVRVHGGATGSGAVVPATAVDAGPAKRAIAAAAADLVQDGMTVMLLSGSTVAAMVPLLAAKKDLTIVTNNLDVGHAAAHSTASHAVVLLGGVVHLEQKTLIGTMAEQNMRSVHVDILFGGAWGVDAQQGVTGTKMLVAGQRHELLDLADTVVVLADAGKLGRTGPARLADPEEIGRVITDAGASADVVAALRAAGITVQVCATPEADR